MFTNIGLHPLWPFIFNVLLQLCSLFLAHFSLPSTAGQFKLKGEYTTCICLIVPSADNLCKQFGPNQAEQNVGPDLDPNCLRIMYSRKICFVKIDF